MDPAHACYPEGHRTMKSLLKNGCLRPLLALSLVVAGVVLLVLGKLNDSTLLEWAGYGLGALGLFLLLTSGLLGELLLEMSDS